MNEPSQTYNLAPVCGRARAAVGNDGSLDSGASFRQLLNGEQHLRLSDATPRPLR
jgi:hypothetical protein